jgi:hypothetical protein
MASSGMLRRVAFVRTDVSEERTATLIGAKTIGELGITLSAPVSNASIDHRVLVHVGVFSTR